MAQFKKNYFGSSYFGYTTTLDGNYQTAIIDADEPFTGTVDFSILADTTPIVYKGNHPDWVFSPTSNSWVISGDSIFSTTTNSTATFFLCSDEISLNFATGTGSVKIELIDPRDNSSVYNQTISIASQQVVKINKPFQIYNLKITNLSAVKVQLDKITVKVSNIGMEVRTAGEDGVWGEYVSAPLIYNSVTNRWTGSSENFTNKRYVQAKVHLATSDIDIGPIVDIIEISSGDTSKRAENGWWLAAINLSEAAKDNGFVFKKATKILWKENRPEACYSEIRSTSTLNGFPNDTQVKSSIYWKSETVPYVVNRETEKIGYGVPWSRVSLNENSNSSAIIGWNLTPERYNLTNVKNIKWANWNDQSFYPSETAGSKIIYEFYANRTDKENGISPVFIISNPQTSTSRNLTIPSQYANYPFVVSVKLERISGKQTPVVDFVDMYGDMKYNSPSNYGVKNVQISALDNKTGIANHGEITSTSYNWPSNQQVLPENSLFLNTSIRELTISFVPKFANQIAFYFNSKEGESSNRNISLFKATETFTDSVISQVIADEPVVSTEPADENRILFHYAMDGGTVQYPKKTEKEMMTDFSPDLLKNNKYHFMVSNGWPDEKQIVPSPMSWEEFAEMTSSKVDELKLKNPNVKLYNEKIPQGVELALPNHSKNELIKMSFKSNQSVLTKKSVWNGTDNEQVVAEIPSVGDYGYKDWISEEKIFTGYLNPNNIFQSYQRTQRAVYTSNDEYSYIVSNGDTYEKIAKDKGIPLLDLMRKNNNKELIEGEEITIPASFSLPFINPEVVYDNENPYTVEIITDSVKKTDNRILPDNTVILGTDDEEVLKYTFVESAPVTNELTRGPVLNGKDVLFYSNVKRVSNVVDVVSGYVYQPYSKAANGAETGDYILTDNFIDWSPAHTLAKEPAVGSKYRVTYTYATVDTLKISMSSDYLEKSGFDKLWRSEEVKTLDGICTPEKDVFIELPQLNSFSGYSPIYKNVEYLVEDNDLWVKTNIVEKEGKKYLHASMNKENPKRNWYPTMNTGFYYLSDQEYYLYSEPIETVFGKESLPIIKNVGKNSEGLTLHGNILNVVENSNLIPSTFKTSVKF